MTDLEMTKLCAEAMGYKLRDDSEDLVDFDYKPHEHMISIFDPFAPPVRQIVDYDPLCIDAQAMALVKRFMLRVDAFSGYCGSPMFNNNGSPCTHEAYSDESLNHAIVECVAKMQKDRADSTQQLPKDQT